MIGDTYSALTLIGAPALLTNATSVLLLSTANRLGRSVDRARVLGKSLIEEPQADNSIELRGQVRIANRRVLLTIRAISTLYLAVGAFAGSTLAAFLSALIPRATLAYDAAVAVTIGTGVLGFAALAVAAALLVRESHLAFLLLRSETAQHGEIRSPERLF